MDDFRVKIDLSDFFSSVSNEKKRKKEEFDSIIGDLNLNPIFEEVSSLKKENIERNEGQEGALSTFKSFLLSEKPKKKKKIKIEENINKVKEIPKEPKKEPSLIEKSLGLLSEPSNIKVQNDPLTPLDQKFATLDDLQKHYNTFLTRIQQQLSTLGGGGETRLEFLDDVDRDSAKVNNKFLKYNSSTGKWEGSNAGGGGPAYYATTYITSSSYTITENDYYIGVNYAGAVTITLPIVSVEGTTYIVKDELGEASKGTNRYITILPSGSDLIDGRDRAILAYDYGSLTFVYRNGWRVV